MTTQWRQKTLWLAREIQATAACLASEQHQAVREFGLNRKRWAMLVILERSEYLLTIADLARAAHVSRQAAHRLAVSLAKAGLVEMRPNHADRRILQLDLTPRGRNMIVRVRDRFWQSAIAYAAILDDRAITTTAEVLREIRERLAHSRPPGRARRLLHPG